MDRFSFAQKVTVSRRDLIEGMSPLPTHKVEAEGGCGVVGLACSKPVAGRTILAPSAQMHNRGNGKGGGIAAAGLSPRQMRVSPEQLAHDYLIQVAILDPAAREDVERECIFPFFEVHQGYRTPTMDDYRALPSSPPTLGGKEGGQVVAPDTPELAEITKDVDCARCHQQPVPVAAPSTELPPRSVLCLACHDASPVVKDAFSWAGLGFFGVGMLLVSSIWLRGSIGGRRSAPLAQRVGRLLYSVWDFVVSPRVFRFLWAFLMDGLLHRQVWRESRRRWLIHALMFLAFVTRALLGITTWALASIAPTAALTQALVDKNNPIVAFSYDFLAALVILGAILALYRRFVVREQQLVTTGQDTVAVALLGSIFLMGFVVEGARIVTTDLRSGLAIYSFGGHLVALLMRPIPIAWDVFYGYLWYVHAALVAALVAYLPFSKFMHVLISPLVAAINSALAGATPAEHVEH